MKKLLLYTVFSLFICSTAHSQQTGWWAPPKGTPRNIIIMVADGMGVQQMGVALAKYKTPLNMGTLSNAGYIMPWGGKELTASEASIATALATGEKNSRYVGMNENADTVKNMMEYAKDSKMATGLVTTASVTDILPAAFATHRTDVSSKEAVAVDYLNSSIDLIIGGGENYFNKKRRSDERDLITEFFKKGYAIENKMKNVGKIGVPKTLALVSDTAMYGAGARKEYLSRASENAIRLLNGGYYGYLLVIQDNNLRTAGENNSLTYVADEVNDFDKAVGKVMELAGRDKETLIIVMGTQEVGGLTMKSGATEKGQVDASWTGKKATANLVPVFANGPGAEQFNGFYSTADVFKKIKDYIDNRR